MSGLLSPRLLAAPSTIFATAWSLTISGVLPHHLLVSLARVVAGATLGVALGVVLALVAGVSRLGEDMVDPPLQALRTVPFLGLVPLFILWFGIGEAPKLALVAMGALFPLYLNLFAGIRGVDAGLVDAGNALGLSRGQLIRLVILPAARPAAGAAGRAPPWPACARRGPS